MTDSAEIPPEKTDAQTLQGQGRLWVLGAATVVLVAIFSRPLLELGRFSVSSDLYSHIVLIPFISGYLIWLKREALIGPRVADWGLTSLFLIAGAAATALRPRGAQVDPEDHLTPEMLSFLFLLLAAGSWCLGRDVLRKIAFPIGFLFLMVPIPPALTRLLESFLQNQSATAAFIFFKVAGTPVYYHDLAFQLPGISIEVAPQCSGIHSSLALLIVSLVAGYLFLRSNIRRSVLAAAVIPLAIMRNGFRVFTIGELCVHVGPEMIDSEIHHHGGPVFFALSLIPFLLLTYFLVRSERRRSKPAILTP